MVETCECCGAPATVQLRDVMSEVNEGHSFRCEEHRAGDEAYAGSVGKVHHGWRVVTTLLGGDAAFAEIEVLTLVEVGDQWTANAVGNDSMDEGDLSFSPRQAIVAWVDDQLDDLCEIVEPGAPTKAEAVVAERERCVKFVDNAAYCAELNASAYPRDSNNRAVWDQVKRSLGCIVDNIREEP